MTKTIFITGTAGMIGSNIARELLKTGEKIVGIDNLWRGTKNNMNTLLSYKNFTFRHADIISDRDCFFDMTSDSVLIHTADIVAGIGYVFSNEWSVFQKNVLINTQIARLIHERKPKQFIYLGTACSYPQKLQRSVDNSALSENLKFPADPESGYGWSKLVGEIEFRLAVKEIPTRLTVLDLHNVYGWPCIYKDSTAQVIPSLIYKAINSQDRKLSVWGNGKQGRAFVHVSDVVSAVLSTLNYTGDFSAFMIGPDFCTTIEEVSNLIISHPSILIDQIEYDLTKPTGDIGRFADARLAKVELGWSPVVDFKHGLYDLINHIIKNEK